MRILCSSLRVQGIGDHLLNHWGHPKGRDGVPTITHWVHLTEAHECKTLQTGQQQRIRLSGALQLLRTSIRTTVGLASHLVPFWRRARLQEDIPREQVQAQEPRLTFPFLTAQLADKSTRVKFINGT